MNEFSNKIVWALAVALAVVMTGRRLRSRPARPRTPRPPRRITPRFPTGNYPGDFTGRPTFTYCPNINGEPDPGEVVWTWVPYEENVTEGKDRPVLLIGRDGNWLLGLMLTSKDHHRDAADEAKYGRHWMDLGTGEWDRERRPSEVRLDRILRVDPAGVRREGSVLDKARFSSVARAVEETNGW